MMLLGLGPRKSKLLDLARSLVEEEVQGDEAVLRLTEAAGRHRRWLFDIAKFTSETRLIEPSSRWATTRGPLGPVDDWTTRLLLAAATGNSLDPLTEQEQRDVTDELWLEKVEPEVAFRWLADRVPALYEVRSRISEVASEGLARLAEISDAINPLVGGHSDNPDRVVSSPTAYHLCMRYLSDLVP